jgi:hypothetical protein
MNVILFAADPASLPVKAAAAVLAGILPVLLSMRLRAGVKAPVAASVVSCVAAAVLVHAIIPEEPGVLAAMIGLIVGILLVWVAPLGRAPGIVALTTTAVAVVALATAVFLRIPPREMRRAAENLRHYGGIVEHSNNPWTSYRDDWRADFRDAGIDDDQLLEIAADLAALPGLWLTLSNCPVSDRGLAALAGADRVVWLELGGTQVTDAGLVHVGTLTRMKRLDLHKTRVSDDGLRHLLQLHALETMHLDGTAVTQNGVRQIQAALPKCTVVHSTSERPVSPAAPRASDPSRPARTEPAR